MEAVGFSICWPLSLKAAIYATSDFVDLIPNISAKVLSSELKELEADGLIIRTMYHEIRPEWNTPCRKPAQSWLPR